MRRVLLVLIAASALVLAVQRLWVALASEETRIRWRLQGMAQGFDEQSTGACLRGVAEGWRDEGSQVDRAQLADGLRVLFFRGRDAESGRFPYRAEIEREALSIEVDPADRGAARATFTARFLALSGEDWSPTWRVRVEGRLRKHPERGWQLVETRHETLLSDGRLVRDL